MVSVWKGTNWVVDGFSSAHGALRLLWKDARSCYPASAMAGTLLRAREERYKGDKWVSAAEMESKKQLPAVKPAAGGSQLRKGWSEAGKGLQGRENQLDDTRLSPEALIHALKCCDAIKMLEKDLTLSPAFAASRWVC